MKVLSKITSEIPSKSYFSKVLYSRVQLALVDRKAGVGDRYKKGGLKLIIMT